MSTIIEKGDILYVYRPRVETEVVESIDHVQRFEIVLIPDDHPHCRLLVVGSKSLPLIDGGSSEARNWLMTVASEPPEAIGQELHPLQYQTKTRGERRQGEAIPVAEGRYHITDGNGDARFTHHIHRPTDMGPPQQAFRIRTEATFIFSARNPAVDVPGFPDTDPGYPKALQRRFAEERWLPVDDPRLIDAVGAQLLLIGARIGTSGQSVTGRPNAFARLGLDRRLWPNGALKEARWASPAFKPATGSPAGDRSAGGRRGGQVAREHASAAGIAQALGGIDFPQGRAGLVRHARDNEAGEEIIATLEEMPARRFTNMADVQRALATIR